MEGVRQQAEQHLASAHAEARSIIQKAQTTAADLQVNALQSFCLVVKGQSTLLGIITGASVPRSSPGGSFGVVSTCANRHQAVTR